jgi:hypothetical protein
MTADQKMDHVVLEDVLRHSKDALKWIGVLYKQTDTLEEFETQLYSVRQKWSQTSQKKVDWEDLYNVIIMSLEHLRIGLLFFPVATVSEDGLAMYSLDSLKARFEYATQEHVYTINCAVLLFIMIRDLELSDQDVTNIVQHRDLYTSDQGLICEDSRINTAVHVALVELKSSLMKTNESGPKDVFSWLHKRLFDYSSHLPGRKAASYQIKTISEIDPIFEKTTENTPNVELIALLAAKFYSISFKASLLKVILDA